MISVENEADVLVYTFETLIRHCQICHYLFAAQCVWGLASLVVLQSHSVEYIDNSWT